MPFFHNGKISGELRIEHFIEAEPPQSGNHLSCDQRTRIHPHRFSDADTNGRRCLHDHDFVGIQYFFKHFIRIVAFDNGASRAHQRALSAVGTGNIAKPFFHIRGYFTLYSAFGNINGIHCLHVGAYRNASATQYTFIRIAHNRRRSEIAWLFFFCTNEPHFLHTKIGGNGL